MKPFVCADDWRPTTLLDQADLDERMRLMSPQGRLKQLELF